MLSLVKNNPPRSTRDIFLEQLIQEHDVALRRFIRVRIGVPADCDDIVQSVYTRVIQIDDIEKHLEARLDTVRSYLLKIAANIITDRYRKSQARREADHMSFENIKVLSTVMSPERQIQGKRILSQILDALERIKPEYRHAFVLSRMENMSYREISDTMGVSVSTVEKYISAALFAIREKVTDYES